MQTKQRSHANVEFAHLFRASARGSLGSCPKTQDNYPTTTLLGRIHVHFVCANPRFWGRVVVRVVVPDFRKRKPFFFKKKQLPEQLPQQPPRRQPRPCDLRLLARVFGEASSGPSRWVGQASEQQNSRRNANDRL